MRKKFIAGNWKMNKTAVEAAQLCGKLKELIKKPPCDVVVCVPFTAIDTAKRALSNTPIEVGAQNICWAQKGAFTGEISAEMLIDAGASYAIVGHSERRAMFGETDQTVNKRAKQALLNDIVPIICVGETDLQRKQGLTESVLTKQLSGSLLDLTASEAEKIIVAYEPVWAIGTGNTATKEQAEQTIAFVRKTIDTIFGTGKKTRILYGGSMNAANAASLLSMQNIDGGLIGGASLIAEDFAAIINACK